VTDPMRAPPLATTQWYNTPPLTLDALRGRVVVIGSFQMLCPGCVSTGLPQLQRVYDGFDPSHVAVIGLHTVFEHHAAMTPLALQAFLHEYRIHYPVAVDQPAPVGDIPVTMARYGFQGTPSLALIDKSGRLRLNHFGHKPDLQLGAAIAQLLGEAEVLDNGATIKPEPAAGVCAPDQPCS
jgi:thiol-disulfide isomerase/thioredoxin